MNDKKIKFNILKFIKSHKWQTGVCAGVLVVTLGVCGVAIAQENLKIANTQKAIEMAEENGGISVEALNLLEENGGFAEFGTEIVDPSTGETVKLVQNEDGSISKVITKDAGGNSTGNIAQEAGHTHSYVPHYTNGTRSVTTPVYHPAVTERVCVSPAGTYCNQCGANVTGDCGEHTHLTGHGGTHSQAAKYEDKVVQAAYTENVTTQEPYQYVDYYYCSDCGARQ